MKKISDTVKEKPWVGWLLYLVTVILVFIVGLFGSSILERRSESNILVQTVKPINDPEPRNEVWGENYPREYETYLQTKDTSFASKHGGSHTIDMLARYPDLVVMWGGVCIFKRIQSRPWALLCNK